MKSTGPERASGLIFSIIPKSGIARGRLVKREIRISRARNVHVHVQLAKTRIATQFATPACALVRLIGEKSGYYHKSVKPALGKT